ncbi:hypothetical protein BDZ85DRAFT_256435 [Elsinoe ampelina]|uniref:F-box domain-containing protein n=1 Tax=Elsinoe ampelina TaxID=302913 RepID=A0A6A6GLZ2_9PEZI|nr:hypothetical protein BDZ85DRAFT_256435 [Elsinoe ampelina]
MATTSSSPGKKRSHSQSEAAGPNNEHEPRRLEDLPRELRDEIYHKSLVSSTAIEVAKLRAHQEYKDGVMQVYYNPDPQAKSQSLQGLNMDLLKASPDIAREASQVFYSKNQFAFHGHRDWKVVVDWLRSIGEENLKHLTNIEIDVRQLNRVYQYADGSREDYSEKAINPRHPLIQSPNEDGTWPEGEVDDIDPKMEDIFSTLASCDHGSKLRVDIRYVGGGYPGCFKDPDEDPELIEGYYFSMDLPNLIEAWRSKYSDPEKREIEVVWHTWGPIYDDKTILDIIGDKLKDNGFDIIKSERFEETVESLIQPGTTRLQRTLKVDMKRRPLIGRIIHSEPNIYNTSRPPAAEREEREWNEYFGDGNSDEDDEE